MACADLDEGVELLDKVAACDAISAHAVVDQEGMAVIKGSPVLNVMDAGHGPQGHNELLLVQPVLKVSAAGKLVHNALQGGDNSSRAMRGCGSKRTSRCHSSLGWLQRVGE